ncbi:hypothetical protein AcdelDRAFT_0001, partial [Acidovorax delafieldii 2AN]
MTGFVARLREVSKASWAVVTAITAAVTWTATHLIPDYASDTKGDFLAFALRVYWPECIAAALLLLLIVGTLTAGVRRSAGVVDAVLTSAAQAYRSFRLVPVAERVVAMALLFVVAVGSLGLVADQLSKMVARESEFAHGRMKNWFGTSQQVAANRLIFDAAYGRAVETLADQARRLRDITEGDTSGTVGQWIEDNVEAGGQMLDNVKSRVSQAGLSRADLLLQGTLRAIRPTWRFGSVESDDLVGREQLATYEAALLESKARCEGDGGALLSDVTVAHAVSALGFTRWPQLLYPVPSPIETKRKVLCAILSALSVDELKQAHRAAFSISEAPTRTDWRDKLSTDTIGTSASVVWVSIKRAIQAPVVAAFNVRLFRPASVATVPADDADMWPDREIKPLETAGLLEVAVGRSRNPAVPIDDHGIPATFFPVIYLASGEDDGRTQFYTSASAEGRGLLICRESTLLTPRLAVEVVHRFGGVRLGPSKRCKDDKEVSHLNKVDPANALPGMLSLLEALDASAAASAAPDSGAVRGVLCQTIR